MIVFLILSFLEILAERRHKSIAVEFNFATVFALIIIIIIITSCNKSTVFSAPNFKELNNAAENDASIFIFRCGASARLHVMPSNFEASRSDSDVTR